MPLRIVIASIHVLLLTALSPARAAEATPADLVLVQKGQLPIILTAPHGGSEAVPGVAVRNIAGKPEPKYNIGRDPGTDVIVQAMAREIRAITGQDVYMVMARFDRKYIDANRAADIAFDNPAASPYYAYYHQVVGDFIAEIQKTHRAGLLIDVHGQHKLPDHLVRGTHNGRTVTQLLARAGAAAITGEKGLFGLLEAHGFAVFPSNTLPLGGNSEDAGFNGGYTVAHYGSHRKGGIDAVQLEFGRKYRRKTDIEDWSRRAAASVAAFHDVYLSKSRR